MRNIFDGANVTKDGRTQYAGESATRGTASNGTRLRRDDAPRWLDIGAGEPAGGRAEQRLDFIGFWQYDKPGLR